MQKLSILALAIVMAVGCGKKKDDDKSVSEKTTEMGKDTKPANPETATKPGNDMKTETPAAPPVGDLEEIKAVPADAPKECQDAYAATNKLRNCDKVDMATRKTMAKAWNVGITTSLADWGKATAEQKTTITQSCAQTLQTTADLTKDCP